MGDLDAAHRLIQENHPGAAPEMADAAFRERLAEAYAKARADAGKVDGYPAYVAVLRGFALSFRDPHVSWAPQVQMASQTPPVAPLKAGKAGFGMRAYAGGVWVGIETFDERVTPVIANMRRRLDEIVAARRVVIDVRGNRGGNSDLGDQLIAVLVGQKNMRAAQRPILGGCGVAWRASPGNKATLEEYRARFSQASPALAHELGVAAEEMEVALAAGRNFTSPIPQACLEPRTDLAPPLVISPGRVVILTDEACFSSCLIFVDRMLRLGAIQAGQPTREGNWYMEVRAEALPSGLGSFRTMQKVALEFPRKMGPYLPARPYGGDIADTAALEHWLTEP